MLYYYIILQFVLLQTVILYYSQFNLFLEPSERAEFLSSVWASPCGRDFGSNSSFSSSPSLCPLSCPVVLQPVVLPVIHRRRTFLDIHPLSHLSSLPNPPLPSLACETGLSAEWKPSSRRSLRDVLRRRPAPQTAGQRLREQQKQQTRQKRF